MTRNDEQGGVSVRLVRLERQQSRVADDVRAALASLGRGSTVVGGIALIGVGSVTERPIEAVVLLPHGVIIVIGVDLPDPALRLEAPLGAEWKADGWPLVADDDAVNPATEALDLSQACEQRITELVPGTAPVGTIVAVGPYVETVDQPAGDLAGPVRVLHPTPTTMLAATVSLATAHRPRSVDQVRALIRGLAPSAPELSDEVLLGEGFSRFSDDSPPESLWDSEAAGPTQPGAGAGSAGSPTAGPAAAGSAAADSAAPGSPGPDSPTPVAVSGADWRTRTPASAAPSRPDSAAESDLPTASQAAAANSADDSSPVEGAPESAPTAAAEPAAPRIATDSVAQSGSAAAESRPNSADADPSAAEATAPQPGTNPSRPSAAASGPDAREPTPPATEAISPQPGAASSEPSAAQPTAPESDLGDTEAMRASVEAPDPLADAERTEALSSPTHDEAESAETPALPVFPGAETSAPTATPGTDTERTETLEAPDIERTETLPFPERTQAQPGEPIPAEPARPAGPAPFAKSTWPPEPAQPSPAVEPAQTAQPGHSTQPPSPPVSSPSFPAPRPRPEPAPRAATPASRTVRWLPLGAIGLLVLLVVAAIAVATTGDDTAAAPTGPPTPATQPPASSAGAAPVESLQFALRAAGGDQRCASHAFGDAQASLQQTSCAGVRRASYAATVDGRPAAVTVGIVAFPDAAQAATFKAVADTPGGGGILDLATETGKWGATQPPRFENAAYASKVEGTSVRIVQAVWAPGPSTPDDPGLARAVKAALDLPAQ